MREALLQEVRFENAPVQSKQCVQLSPLATIQIEPARQKQPALPTYQIPCGSSLPEELSSPHFVYRSASICFFRSLPNHSGSPVSKLLTTVRNFCFFPR